MSTIEMLLLIALIPLTALNLYYLTIGRKKKQAASQHYRQVFSELEKKTLAEREKRHLQFDETRFFLSDDVQGVQVSFSRESRQMAITLKDAFHLIPFSDLQACLVRHDEAKGKYSNIRVEIQAADKVITIVFGARAWRPKSFLGKVVIENAEEFCDLVRSRCSPSVSDARDPAHQCSAPVS